MVKNHFIRQLYSLALFLLITLFLLPPTAVSATAKIIPEPGVSAAAITELQQTVDAFNSVTKNTMDVSLDDEIRIIICPDREKFIEVINRELPSEKPKTSIPAIYAMTIFSNHTIFIDESGSSKKTAAERAEIIGSYLFRHLLLQLNGQTLPNDLAVESRGVLNYLYWMDQGISDYIGALVAEKQGLESLEQWERHRVLFLRGDLSSMTQRDLELLNVTTWANFSIASPAPKADLMAWYLLHVLKTKDLKAMVIYYQQCNGTTNATAVWESVFGLHYREFAKDFSVWYNHEVLLL